MRRIVVAAGTATAALLLTAAPAFACGGLVAPDGDVRLDKATTFVAWHDGVEHYVTSFAYTGAAADVGWIVPLPAVPSKIEAAGRWTLQRLERELNPPPQLAFAEAGAAAPADSVVVEHVQVEALDITVLKGSGSKVVDWCVHNGFLLPPETKAHLLQYAQASPIFMAAKYNSSVAQQRGLQSGDGVPLLMTMRTSQLWVPLEVLANDNSAVNADLFLLTDQPLHTVGAPFVLDGLLRGNNVDGAQGFSLVRQEQMNPVLFHDLSTDRNMAWVPSDGWLTYLSLNAPSAAVTYDLGVGGDSVIRLASYGTAPAHVGTPAPDRLLPALGTLAALLLVAASGYVVWRRSRLAMSSGTMSSAMGNPSTRPKK
jgi:Uncharacterized protein conserved in bacteria (DUF2330)